MSPKYRVRFVNFNYYSQDEFDHLADAIAYVNSKGFEAAVEQDGKIVASKTTFSGWAMRDRSLVPRTFSEIREGDEILAKGGFHKVLRVVSSDRQKTVVEIEGNAVVDLDSLVFCKG